MQMNVMRAAAAALLLTACSKNQPQQQPAAQSTRPAVLHDVPTVANSQPTDTSGTDEAERASYRNLASIDSVARYYRRMLPPLGWNIMSDQGDTAQVDLYLRNVRHALWIHIEKRLVGSAYTLIATNADSATAPARNPAAPRP